MRKVKFQLLAFLFGALSVSFTSCNSDDPEKENEGEVITDVTLKFTEVNQAGTAIGTPFEVKASDSNGVGLGNNLTIETINLVRGKRYQMEISLFNSIENEDITKEVKEEGDEHQFFFLGTAVVGSPLMTYTYDDQDKNGNPIGLKGFVQVVENPSFNNARLRVILRHDLNKAFPGANNPNFQNFANAGGETDLDVEFPVVIN